MTANPPRVSFAIPVFNEEEVVPALLERVGAVLDATPGGPHEVVLVDDGSRDRTAEMLREAAREDPRLVVVELSRNFGHQTALTAALDHTTGDVVLVLDGDLQDPPEMLPRFLEHWRDGYDVVYGRRVLRKESPLLRAAYFLFYRLIGALSDVSLPLDAGDFALLSRQVVDAMKSSPERHRYLRGLRTWVGFRQIGIDVERAARAAGETKYSLRKLLQLAFDGIFAFSVVPLRGALLLGLMAIVLSSLYTVYAVVARLVGLVQVPGFTATLVVVVFLSGMQLLFLGVVGEYVGRIYREVKRRPHYLVRTVTRGPEA
ncbi:MAG: glycosyltransferase family 2 protein [Acidobacteriota bacterium]